MLKALGEKSISEGAAVWEEGRLPGAWEDAVVIPIRKPGKDPSKPTSYRPIALKTNVCKVMERVITQRLSYKLEKRGRLAGCQSGFRRGSNTMDAVVWSKNQLLTYSFILRKPMTRWGRGVC